MLDIFLKRILAVVLSAVIALTMDAQVSFSIGEWYSFVHRYEHYIPTIILEMLGKEAYQKEVVDRASYDYANSRDSGTGVICVGLDGNLTYIKTQIDRADSWVDTIGRKLCDYMVTHHTPIPITSVGGLSASEINNLDCKSLRSTIEREKANEIVEIFINDRGRKLLQKDFRYVTYEDLRGLMEKGLFKPFFFEVNLSNTIAAPVYQFDPAKIFNPKCKRYDATALTGFPSTASVEKAFKEKYPEKYAEYQASGELDYMLGIIRRINVGLADNSLSTSVVAKAAPDSNIDDIRRALKYLFFTADTPPLDSSERVKFVSGTPLTYYEGPYWLYQYSPLLPHYYLIKFKGKEWYKENIYYRWLELKENSDSLREFECKMKLNSNGTFSLIGRGEEAKRICRELADSLEKAKSPIFVFFHRSINIDYPTTDDCKTLKDRIQEAKADNIINSLSFYLNENRLEEFFEKYSKLSDESRIQFYPTTLIFKLYKDLCFWNAEVSPNTEADADRYISSIISKTERLLEDHKLEISATAGCSEINNDTYTDMPSAEELRAAFKRLLPEIAEEFIRSKDFKRLLECLNTLADS